eukprot:c23625_g7_i1 orf=2-1012(-)
MRRRRSTAERLCKGFERASDIGNIKSRSQEPQWINGSCNPSVHETHKIPDPVAPCTSKGLRKARDTEEEEEEKDCARSGTGYTWRMVRLAEALPLYENGLLPKPTVNDLVHIIQMCRHERDLKHAIQWHAYVRKCGLDTHTLLGNDLVLMLAELGRMHDALQAFNGLLNRSECAWNSLIRGFVRCGKPQHALTLYHQMQTDASVYPCTHAYVALLKACAKLKNLKTGLNLHAKVAVSGQLKTTLCLGSALVNMYAECGSLKRAQQVFDELEIRNTVSWNALITAYVKHGCGEEALERFEQMQVKGLVPSSVTYLCILKACGSVRAAYKGQQIHDEIA